MFQALALRQSDWVKRYNNNKNNSKKLNEREMNLQFVA